MPSNPRLIDPNFPNLPTYPGEGLIELPVVNNSESKIKDFNALINVNDLNYQPTFFISLDSWKKLFKGLRKNGSKWLPDGYEIFGFVFCIAFTDEIPTRAYFRIRTIIKDKRIKSTTKEIKVEIEIDNIAYVDIEKATRQPGKNCIKFIDSTFPEYRMVNGAVKRYKERISSRPVAFQENPPHVQNLRIPLEPYTQEGNIFGRNGHFILNNLKKGAKGSAISFAWDSEKKAFSFIFNINPTGETQYVPCPLPHVGCKTEEQ